MTIRLIHRPARLSTPLERPEPRVLAAPPQQGDAAPGGIPLRTLLPVFGSLSSIVMIVVLRANPVMVVIGAVILVIALAGGIGMAVGQRGQAARARRRERERYLDYLEALRSELRDHDNRARTRALALHPSPLQLGSTIRNPEQLWERRRSDTDFLEVRVGAGAMPWHQLSLPVGNNPVQPFDTIMAGEAETLINTYSRVAGMPATVSLRGIGTVAVVGETDQVFALIRSMVAQLAVSHAPEDVKFGFAVPEDRLAALPDVGLLPHVLLDAWDGPMPGRRIAPDTSELLRLLHDELQARARRAAARQRNGVKFAGAETPLLLVLDHTEGEPANAVMPDGFQPEQLGVTILSLVTDRLHEPSDTRLRFTFDREAALTIERIRDKAHSPVTVAPDQLEPALFASLASQLAPLRLSMESRDTEQSQAELDVLQLLGVPSITALSAQHWQQRSKKDFLRVNVATGDDGGPVPIDLKESAHGGMGPHGICIGATGSGKSEFLRTLVLSLVLAHGPEDLSMILVDYKGGAAFTPFQPLPHIAGLMDNLENDTQLIERTRASISGEIVRRQRLLKEAGSFASITDYRAARAAQPELGLAPLPHLFIIIDEFGELLTAEPDFIDLLLQIGRIGRALGIHLLLASQRIEGGKLRGLDTYLSYRVGLRTFSEQESTTIIETPDAFHLPPEPGWGYLKVDTTVYTRFKAGYVSGPVPGERAHNLAAEETDWGVFVQPPYNTIEASMAASSQSPTRTAEAGGPSLMDACVARLRTGTAPTSPVWLPPLPDRLPLFQVIEDRDRPPLHVPVGLLDEPLKQAQHPWRLDLTRSGGHFAIIGAPQTGRSTFLRTFAAGVASTHTPKQVTMYGLDLTGAGLARLEDFPHVGGVATRANREQQVRLLEELQHMIGERERLFRLHRIESLSHFRNKHAAGELDIVSPDIVLLVDGYGLTKQDFDYLADQLADLLTRGSSFGIHLVLALTRWNEVAMSLQPLIGNRIELRLNDPTESTIKRKLSETIRSNQPGRALTDEQLFAQVALPVIDDVDDDHVGDALTELALQTAKAWSGPSASPIRLLPENLDPGTMPDPFDEPDGIPIGLRQDTMEPVLLDFAGADQHVLVLGDAQSGKTTLLRQVCTSLIDRLGPEELVIALMEPRSGLAASIPDDYLGGHANNVTKARQLAAALALELDKRQNEGADASLRIVIVVDDYDILSSGGNTPLDPLLPYLASARDLNFNVLLTRPVAGAARALYESTIQNLRDTGGTGIILSGERSEGQLWPGVYASGAVPGRGKLIRRGKPPRLIQIANRTP